MKATEQFYAVGAVFKYAKVQQEMDPGTAFAMGGVGSGMGNEGLSGGSGRVTISWS